MPELWPGGPVELPLTFTFDGDPFTIGAIPTTQLLTLCANQQWFTLLTHIDDQQAFAALMDRLRDDDDELDHDHLHMLATRILGRLSGMYIPPRPVGPGGDGEAEPDTGAAEGSGSSAGRGSSGWLAAITISGYLTRFWGLFAAWCAGRNLQPLTLAFHQLVPAGYAWLAEHLPHSEPEGWKKFATALFEDTEPKPLPVVGDARLRALAITPVLRGRAHPIPQPPELPITHPSRRAELEVVQAMMAGMHDLPGDRDWLNAEPV